jgi:hydroxymethylglutaryl-CoA reductase
MVNSRISGFYKRSISERRTELEAQLALETATLQTTLDGGGLTSAQADKVVENVLGVYALPFGVALNFQINGVDHLAPMVVEEPSVIAAASNAARMVRSSGGFSCQMVEDLMTTQVQLYDVPNMDAACAAVQAAETELLQLAADAVPNLLRRGGGPRSLELRILNRDVLVLHIHVDCRDAMGANLVNSIAEAVGPRAAALTAAKLGLRILTNLCDKRRVRVQCRVAAVDLVDAQPDAKAQLAAGLTALDAIVEASRFAELDPYRAATHNKGIMNGIDSVVIATGNDARAVEAGAHAYAAQKGRYAPLAIWRREGETLLGDLELPLALGIVGGTLRIHAGAQLALRISGVKTAAGLSQLAAAVGLASNLAAVRALATEGIQRGHMGLHARSIAVAAGAVGDEVERVAAKLRADGRMELTVASSYLAAVRTGNE